MKVTTIYLVCDSGSSYWPITSYRTHKQAQDYCNEVNKDRRGYLRTRYVVKELTLK